MKFKRLLFATAVAAFMILTYPHAAFAASVGVGRVEGIVTDALGRPISGARLEIQGADGKVIGTATSDDKGQFAFSDLAAGTYAITTTAAQFETGNRVAVLSTTEGAKVDIALSATGALAMTLLAKRLDEVRNGLSPQTGTSIYHVDHGAIENLAQGQNTPVNQVLQAAPGVAQDSYGQVHVRGEHANLQYRINGIILPEGISGFGQSVDTRFAERLDFLTGALPAQYGDRTAGIVELTTKGGAFANGGRVSLYGGSHSWFEPSVELNGSSGSFNYYLTGSYLENDLGIESPTSDPNPIHDHTSQGRGFAYLSYLLDPSKRLVFMAGDSVGKFQIPNNPDQTTNFTLTGVPSFSSSDLNENQLERNRYEILALQGSSGRTDYQLSIFNRFTSTHFTPDPIGDLMFNGVASDVYRSDNANGLQGDLTYRLTDNHTLRTGVFYSRESTVSNNTSAVFPALPDGTQTGSDPLTIVDDNSKIGTLYGLYVQDEWKATEKLTINYGLRGDQVDTYIQESQLSPRLNALYRVSNATAVHVGYARYFTPPPIELVAPRDLALFENTTNTAGPNAVDDNVKSERANYYDIGVTHQVTTAYQAGLDGYYKDVRHLLDEGQFGAALVFTPFNYARGKIYGLEWTNAYHENRLSAYFNVAYSVAQATQIESGQFNFDPEELDYIANHYVYLDHDQRYTSSAGVAYQFGGTTYSTDAIYGSGLRSGFANTGQLPGYVQVNLAVSHHFDLPGLGLIDGRFVVINALDHAYEIRDGSGIGVGAPQWGPRRAFYIGVSKPFGRAAS